MMNNFNNNKQYEIRKQIMTLCVKSIYDMCCYNHLNAATVFRCHLVQSSRGWPEYKWIYNHTMIHHLMSYIYPGLLHLQIFKIKLIQLLNKLLKCYLET